MQMLGALLGVIAPILFIVGLVAVVKPSRFRLRKRRHALALWWLFVPILALSDALDPQPIAPGQADPGNPITGGILLWLIGMGIGGVVCRVIDRRRAPRPTPVSAPNLEDEVAALRRMGAGAAGGVPGRSVAASMRRSVIPQSAAAGEEQWQEGQQGRSASFTYIDRDGVVTDRVITNWVSNGPHILGWCADRRATRTFRKDRIEDWMAG